jgi:hypothetical protein
VLDSRCFPHIVNLACQAVLSAITNLDYAKEDADDYIPSTGDMMDNLERDPIATVRSLIRAVCADLSWRS